MKVLSSLFTRLVQVLGGSLHNGCNPSQHCVVESSWGSVWRGECRELLSHLSLQRSADRPGLLTCDHQHVSVVTQLLVTMGKKGRKNKPGKKKVEPTASLVARLGVGPVQFCVCYIFSTSSVYIVGSRLSSQSMQMVQTRNVNLSSQLAEAHFQLLERRQGRHLSICSPLVAP